MKESHIKTINLGRGEGGGNKTFLASLGHFLMYVNLFGRVALMKKYCHKNKPIWNICNYNRFHGYLSCKSEEWGCLGILMNNLAPMKNFP